MAKQVGPVLFTGTIDGIIFYKLGDKYYSRSKGSYKSAKHMRRNHKYHRTMQKADQFGGASKLTQEVYYRYLPKQVRKHGLFGKLTGRVNTWLQEGKSREEATELLIAHCQLLAATVAAPPAATTTQNQPRSTANKQRSTPKQALRIKQARYLSRWKVKGNGNLQIAKLDIHSIKFSDVFPYPHNPKPTAESNDYLKE